MPQRRTGSPSQRGVALPGERSVQLSLPLHPTSVRLARQATRRLCRAWRTAPAQDTAELAVSELFGNAVREGAGRQATLRMSWTPRRLRVEVCDASTRRPVVREAGLEEEGGRGLWLIRETAVRWGTQPLPTGKCVWAEFALSGAA